MDQKQQLCTFYLDAWFFGMDVQTVREVLLHQELTPVPLAPDEVRGVINLRGQIVTAIDLRRRLDMKEREADASPVNVVVETGDELISFLVDKIGEVIEVDVEQFEHPPDTLKGIARDLILGAYKLPEQLLLVLDLEKTADLDFPELRPVNETG